MYGSNVPSSSFGRPKLSTSPLPSTYSDAVHEKNRLTHGPNRWFTPLEVTAPTLPGRRARRVRVWVPTSILHMYRRRGPVARGRRGVFSFILMGIVAVLMIFSLHKRFGTRNKSWPEIIAGPPPTLVYGRSDLRRIWLWEIASGHYPSSRPCEFFSPLLLGLVSLPLFVKVFASYSTRLIE